MPKAKKNAPAEEPTFEESITQLESIVEEMESGEMPLEKLLIEYETGVKLVKDCYSKLEVAEKRIHTITRNAEKAASRESSEQTKPETNTETDDEVSLF